MLSWPHLAPPFNTLNSLLRVIQLCCSKCCKWCGRHMFNVLPRPFPALRNFRTSQNGLPTLLKWTEYGVIIDTRKVCEEDKTVLWYIFTIRVNQLGMYKKSLRKDVISRHTLAYIHVRETIESHIISLKLKSESRAEAGLSHSLFWVNSNNNNLEIIFNLIIVWLVFISFSFFDFIIKTIPVYRRQIHSKNYSFS